MTTSNNVEQFNAQVKRMSERLRGESASPADTQTNEGAVEEGPNPLGSSENNVGTAASLTATQQVRRKGTSGRRGVGTSRLGMSGPTASEDANTTSTQDTQAGDETAEKDGEISPESGGIPDPTARQPAATADESAHERGRIQLDSTQLSNSPGQDAGMPARDSDAQPTAGVENFIAPEVIGRMTAGGGTCKPQCPLPALSDAAYAKPPRSDATYLVMPP